MPSIEPRRNQNGTVTSYRLIVSGGLDKEGKQIKRRMLWIPPNRNISDRQMLKEATAAAYKFEEQIKNGSVISVPRMTCTTFVPTHSGIRWPLR